MSKIDEIEARRAARKAKLEEQRQAQLEIDLEALDALEVEHGDARVVRINVEAFTPGLPTMIALLTPDRAQIRRYQDQCKPKANGKPGDVQKASEVLAAACLAYPSAEIYQSMLEAYPGLYVVASRAAADRVAGFEQEDAKS